MVGPVMRACGEDLWVRGTCTKVQPPAARPTLTLSFLSDEAGVAFIARHAGEAAAGPSSPPPCNTKGYSSTYLAMGFANVRAGTQKRRAVFGYPPEH